MSLKVEDHGRVRKLTLNRPEQLNAFNNEQYAAVRDALKQTEEEPGIAVAVLTGEGRQATRVAGMG